MMPMQATPAQGKKVKPWEPPTGSKVTDLWEQMQDDLLEQRRNYWFNTSFFSGQQWVGYDNASATIRTLDFVTPDEDKTRATVNKIRPRVKTMLGRMQRVPLEFEVRPDGIDSSMLHKARIANSVLSAKAHRQNWTKVRHENLHNTVMGGVAAIAVEPAWEYEDEPVADGLGDFIKMPSRPATGLTALSCAEFGVEPGTRDIRQARFWIRATCAAAAQVQERYQLPELPATDADVVNSSMQRDLLSARKSSTLSKQTQVLVYYERPNGQSPGCVLHVVAGKVVEQGEWTFPFKDRLNLYTFTQDAQAATWKGDTFLNDCRAIQKAINQAYTTFNEHALRVAGAKLAVAYGTQLPGDDEMSSDVGEYVMYDNSAGPAPQWMQPPQIPRWLREHVDNMVNDLDDLFSSHAVSYGVAPGSRSSGNSLSILAEKDDTPLAMMVVNQQQGWQALAEMVLATDRALMEQVDQAGAVEGAQPMEVSDVVHQQSGAPIEVRWTADDIPKQPTVYIALENVMPRSQAAVTDQMIHLAQSFPQMFMGYKPQQLAKMTQVPDANAFGDVADVSQTEAEWENNRFEAGADDQEVRIEQWQNHDTHVRVHNEFRASSGYRNSSPECKQFVDMHVQAHAMLAQQLMLSAAAREPVPPTPQAAPAPGAKAA